MSETPREVFEALLAQFRDSMECPPATDEECDDECAEWLARFEAAGLRMLESVELAKCGAGHFLVDCPDCRKRWHELLVGVAMPSAVGPAVAGEGGDGEQMPHILGGGERSSADLDTALDALRRLSAGLGQAHRETAAEIDSGLFLTGNGVAGPPPGTFVALGEARPFVEGDGELEKRKASASVPTWDDAKAAALHDPALHRAVTLAECGQLTREQALTGAVLHLGRQCRFLSDELARRMGEEHIMCSPRLVTP